MKSFVYGLCALMWVGLQGPIQACGMAYPAGASAALTEEDALILWQPESQTQTLIRRSYFQSDQRQLGFLVPTPTRPTVGTAPDDLFGTLVQQIQPPVKNEWILSLVQAFLLPQFIGAQGSGVKSPDPEQVKVLEQRQVGPYQVSVLQASQADALQQWLQEHHYPFRPALRDWLATYVQAGWFLTVFQVNQSPQGQMALPAVSLSFQTERPFYPYTEPADSPAQDDRKRRLFLLSPQPMQSFYEPLQPELFDGAGKVGGYYNALGISSQRSMRLYQAPVPAGLSETVQALGLNPENLWLSAWLDLATQRPAPEKPAARAPDTPAGPTELYFYPYASGEPYTPRPVTGRTFFIPLDLMGALGYVGLRLRQRKHKRRARQQGL